MPNWCDNILWVDGDPASIQCFKASVRTSGHDLGLGKLHPMPEALQNTISPGDEPNWYDWCVKNWGTKWDVEGKLTLENSEMLEFCFLSAWSPPIPWLRKVSKDYPKLRFRLRYIEEGVGFMGIAKVKNGKVDDKWLDMK